MSTSLLDLAGVLLIGLVGALAVTTVQSQPPPQAIDTLMSFFGIEDVSGPTLVASLAAVAAIVLLSKSIISTVLTRRVFAFLANRQALVTSRLVRELLSRPLTFVSQRSSQETSFALIQGAGAATLTILGQFVIAVSEVSLLVILSIALFAINPVVTVASIIFFGLVATALQGMMGARAGRIGAHAAKIEIASLNSVQEAIGAYREIVVSNRRHLYVRRIEELRWTAARLAADTQYLGMLPKYVFEAALVLGGFMLASILFLTQDAVVAVGTLALFLAASSRVMPSLLRLQGASLSIRGAAGGATPTFELAAALSAGESDEPRQGGAFTAATEANAQTRSEWVADVSVEHVTVSYPSECEPALSDVTFRVHAGESVAVIGRSGSGKSTLVDAVLGVLSPSSGRVTIGGLSPLEAIQASPGGIAYVPQDGLIADASIRSNVALGLSSEQVRDEDVVRALKAAHLFDEVSGTVNGLDTIVGERGFRLSGGQRQRLFIARALYSRPRLLIMDEATSALDAETEKAITEVINELQGSVTTIVVAHRLSTVQNAAKVIYLEDGRLVAEGTFDEVRSKVPALARQATLMGL
jgi:ABC-type multidrug transport system fused ATPase/permease subunit